MLCRKESTRFFTFQEANGVARTRRMNIAETPLSFPLRILSKAAASIMSNKIELPLSDVMTCVY
ncbi:hypothetical protein PVAP13_8KG031353 [Panicum virgatum]|uniref:Uncharacterized protein n=1 Tax=Panicum virgatum TaxID=38727 RepID=A0A8T0PDT8_PANVG|nr:hypothetical protein PVAP13_8KG031353 [Panicum virgatum]